MKTLLLAGAALAALSIAAHAAPIDFTNDFTYTPYVAGTGSFYAPAATSSSAPPAFTQGQVGSVPNYTTSPFGDNTTPYDVVHANSFADFGGSFGSGSGTFSFLWGTPDSYNTIAFFSGATEIGFATGLGNGSGSFIATLNGLPTFTSVRLTSSQEAFEFAAVSAVPLPAGLPMFGGALLALGGLALVRRSRANGTVKVTA